MPPTRPAGYKEQLWYRGVKRIHLSGGNGRVGVFRSEGAAFANVDFSIGSSFSLATISAPFDEAALVLLRDSLNDALADLIALRFAAEGNEP